MPAILDRSTVVPAGWVAEEWDALVAALTRRRLLGGGLALGAISALAGCGLAAPASTATADRTWSFTDDRGTAITLPKPPERVVAFIDCAAALRSFGVQPIGYFGPGLRKDGTPDPRSGTLDLQAVQSVNTEANAIDLEKLAALKPDLIVTTMWAKDGLTQIQFGAAKVLEQVTAIAPVVGISMLDRSVPDVIDRYGTLAAALGVSRTTGDVVGAQQRFTAACDAVRKAAAAKPGLRVLFGFPVADQVWVADPAQWPECQLLRSLGVTIVEPQTEQHGTGNPFYAVSWERIGLHPADLIMNQVPTWPRGQQALWDRLPAVQAGQVAGWGPVPFWLLYTYDNYTKILTDFAALLERSRIVARRWNVGPSVFWGASLSE